MKVRKQTKNNGILFVYQHYIIMLLLYPHHKMWGGYTGFALSVSRSVGPSVRPSVSNSCPLYNSFTNGRISFKLE